MYDALKNFLSQQADREPGLTAARVKKMSNLPGPLLQTLFEPLPWDWQVPGTGSMVAEAYDFCDRMPSSPNGENYVRSADSFSDNYREFLGLLDQNKFPDPSALARAVEANTPPVDAASPTPFGWTTVNFTTTVVQRRPGWTIPIYPSDWIGKVSNVPNPMKLDLSGSGITLALGEQYTVVRSEAIVKFGFAAAAWGSIPISPGSWYASSIVKLVKMLNGPYISPELNNDKIFGESGLLPSRVAEFIVALNPSAEIEVQNAALSAITPLSTPTDSVRFAGFSFTAGTPAPGTIPASINYEAASSDSTRITVSSSFDQAYIIAVYVTPGANL